MANDGFNGSTISIAAGGQTPLLDVNFGDSAAEIDITGCGDTMHRYLAGLPDPNITFSVVGHTAVSIGDTGAVVIAWFDDTADTINDMIVVGVDVSGSLDGKITSNITLRPTTDA